MTPTEQIRCAELVQSVYDGAKSVPEGWGMLAKVNGEDAQPFGVVVRDNLSGKVALAFRGTKTTLDWLRDFEFCLAPSPFGVGRTERGFTAEFQSLRCGFLDWEPDWYVGHSLGGPLAAFSALSAGNLAAEVLMIGSPQPGDGDFAAWAASKLAAVHRWENRHDMVPDAPGRFLGYRDIAGTIAELDFAKAIGVDWLDVPANHSLANYVAVFKRSSFFL